MADADDFPQLYYPDSEGGFPWDKPCWNNDWEYKLLDKGYKTLKKWNKIGRVIKKGEKGIYLPCKKINVFNESQTSTLVLNEAMIKRYVKVYANIPHGDITNAFFASEATDAYPRLAKGDPMWKDEHYINLIRHLNEIKSRLGIIDVEKTPPHKSEPLDQKALAMYVKLCAGLTAGEIMYVVNASLAEANDTTIPPKGDTRWQSEPIWREFRRYVVEVQKQCGVYHSFPSLQRGNAYIPEARNCMYSNTLNSTKRCLTLFCDTFLPWLRLTNNL